MKTQYGAELYDYDEPCEGDLVTEDFLNYYEVGNSHGPVFTIPDHGDAHRISLS